MLIFQAVFADTQLTYEWMRILALTLIMTLLSTMISAIIGMPLGTFLASSSFPGRRFIRRLMQTGMSLPPVVAGLLVFLLLSRQGPLGSLRLLFSLPAMIIAQCLLIIPIMTSLTCSIVESRQKPIRETLLTLGQPAYKIHWIILKENSQALVTVMLTGFGRAISEVGAVMMVGGNIAGKTRVLTTAIMLETNRGNFTSAIVLGVVLMLLALLINIVVNSLKEEDHVS